MLADKNSDADTDIRTNRHAHHSTPLAYYEEQSDFMPLHCRILGE